MKIFEKLRIIEAGETANYYEEGQRTRSHSKEWLGDALVASLCIMGFLAPGKISIS